MKNTNKKYVGALALLMLTIGSQPALADWINLTGSETAPNIAEIYVLDDRVRVKLEVYIGDLDKFDEVFMANLSPRKDPENRQAWLDTWENFKNA